MATTKYFTNSTESTHSESPPATRPPRPVHQNIVRIAHRAAQFALEKKATDIKIFNVSKLTSIADFFVICTGSTDTHVKAITDYIIEQSEIEHVNPWHVEGRQNYRWVLIDFVDVVVHIFQPEVREYYGLERLWGDAEIEEIRDEYEDKS
jgi:ribosome-associated protein